MRQRCLNAKHPAYPKYGGRGIAICSEWDDFKAFHAWAMANGYEDALSIDRINNDGNYEPSNCRWATSETQVRNRSNSRKFTLNGVTKSAKEWADSLGITRGSLTERIDAGWPLEVALTTPKTPRH